MKRIDNKTAWIMWSIPTLFYALVWVLRVAPGILKNDIMDYYGIDALKFSLIPAFYYAGYASMQIPVSFSMDRFKLNKVMAILMIATGVGLVLLSRAFWFPLAVFGCFIIGAGTTVSVLGSSNIINSNFHKHSYSFMFGLTLTSGLFAGACAGKIISMVTSYFNWQSFYMLATIFCIVLAIAALSLIKTSRKHAQKSNFSLRTVTAFILKDKFVILLALFSGFMTGPMQGFADVWGLGFLSKSLGFERSTAIFINSLCFLGYGIGAPIIGKMAQKYDLLKESLVTCGIVMALSFLTILFVPNLGSASIGTLLFLSGLGSAYPPLTFAIALHSTKKEFGNVAIGISNMILMIFGSVYHTLIGLLYTTSPTLGISIIPLGVIIGTIGTIFIFWKKR